MKLCIPYILIFALPFGSLAFVVSNRRANVGGISRRPSLHLSSESQQDSTDEASTEVKDSVNVVNSEVNDSTDAIASPEIVDMGSMTQEEKEEVVGNLVADDEWNGLTLELSELIRMSIVEDLKKNAREFLDKDEYKMGTSMKGGACHFCDGLTGSLLLRPRPHATFCSL